MELVPHITLNPSFNIDMLEFIEATDISPSTEFAFTSSLTGRRRQSRQNSVGALPTDDDHNDTTNLVNSESSFPNG